LGAGLDYFVACCRLGHFRIVYVRITPSGSKMAYLPRVMLTDYGVSGLCYSVSRLVAIGRLRAEFPRPPFAAGADDTLTKQV
jgi:hypothetical protein